MNTLVNNKKVGFDYVVEDKMLCGIKLKGWEVKSLRSGHGSLDGSYVIIRDDGTLLMKNSYVKAYQDAKVDEKRNRQLLLRKKEVLNLIRKKRADRFALVPIRIVARGKRILVEIGIAKKKKKYDKREEIKRRDIERENARYLKGF